MILRDRSASSNVGIFWACLAVEGFGNKVTFPSGSSFSNEVKVVPWLDTKIIKSLLFGAAVSGNDDHNAKNIKYDTVTLYRLCRINNFFISSKRRLSSILN